MLYRDVTLKGPLENLLGVSRKYVLRNRSGWFWSVAIALSMVNVAQLLGVARGPHNTFRASRRRSWRHRSQQARIREARPSYGRRLLDE